MKKLAVCIPTFRRPALLARLLDSVANMDVPPGWDLEIRVVDNDVEASARQTVLRFAESQRLQYEVLYSLEPESNISLARNRLLDMGPADAVMFVDDDERVERGCLAEMLRVATATGADVVVGWVAAEVPENAPGWMRRGGFMDHPTEASETRLDWKETRCGCTLVLGKWFYAEDFRFDPAYGRSGGEDVDLFSRMSLRGVVAVAAPRARAWEHLPRERMTLTYLLGRRWRSGMSFHRLHKGPGFRNAPIVRFAGRMTRGIARVTFGLFALLVGRAETLIWGILDISLAAGGLAAWLRPEAALKEEGYGSSVPASRPELSEGHL